MNSHGDVRFPPHSLIVMLSDRPLCVADPRLTAIGEEQARSAHAAWEREILRGVPIPQKYYCSPLTRAIRTLELTFVDVLPTHVTPLIVEVWAIKINRPTFRATY